MIRSGERLDDLQRGGLRILQRPDGFCFGMDSVLLADFAAARAPAKGLAVDLGTGSGVLPLLICARVSGIYFDAIEIQADIADMAGRSVALNNMQERIHVYAMDIRNTPKTLGYERYRLAVANPPYGRSGGGIENPDGSRRTARHEGTADIAAICACAGSLLQNGGRLAVVFPAPRFLELCDAMRGARIEPKHVRFVHPKWGEAPNLVLVDGVKAAKPMLHFLRPLYVRDVDGNETEEIHQIYEGEWEKQ